MSELGKYIAQEVTPLEEGKYTGVINDIQRSDEKFDYTRYTVEMDNEEKSKLTVSFPSTISVLKDGTPTTQHAKFLTTMKVKINPDTDLVKEIKKLIGVKISCLVENVDKKQGTFSEIVKTSVKPL